MILAWKRLLPDLFSEYSGSTVVVRCPISFRGFRSLAHWPFIEFHMLKKFVLPVAAGIFAATLALTTSAEAQNVNVRTVRIATGLTFPTFVTHAPGDTSRLFITQKTGAIRIFDLTTNTLLPTPFLSITVAGGTSENDERGLLGLAFDPDYANNGQFYVYYTGTGTNVLARYTRSAANPNVANATGVTMMSWADPFSNHNGGWIGFGPDGNLYMGVGDGGSANDPNGAGQSLATRLGKLHRIKPTVGGAAPYYTVPKGNPFLGGASTIDDEIWSYGLRNPWRCSFDRENGDLFIADVGQNAVEEINFQKAGAGAGRNYGWRCMEGLNCSGLSGCTCNAATLTMPFRTYGHVTGTGGGFSITGGYVYRGCAIPSLQGTYFYADYVTNNVWSLRYNRDTGVQTEFTVRNTQITPSLDGFAVNQISSFGEDANGEIYICDQGSTAGTGAIFKIVPTTGNTPCTPPCPAVDINCDGVVDAADLAALLNNWSGIGTGDINDDGGVDAADLAALLNAWGQL
jgi:glucose/arabinose dehydrogenase